MQFPHLSNLDVSSNDIYDADTLRYLASCPFLKMLNLTENKVAVDKHLARDICLTLQELQQLKEIYITSNTNQINLYKCCEPLSPRSNSVNSSPQK